MEAPGFLFVRIAFSDKSEFVDMLWIYRFVDNKAYPMRGSCPSGRESAFWKADGKHQGLRALDPGTIAALTGRIKQLQVCCRCCLLQLLYEKNEIP